MPFSNKPLTIGARESALSQVQFKEFCGELLTHYPDWKFQALFMSTIGDQDQKTSLRTMEKTDFFTRELDQALLDKRCRITLHSAKDLPDPLPKDIQIAAITKGVNPADALVLQDSLSVDDLPDNFTVATSSVRREEVVRSLFPFTKFIDLRGCITDRIAYLAEGKAHGVVVAEAALIRLQLDHLNRIILPGETTPRQGQLAVLIREDDKEMKELLTCVNSESMCFI